MTHFHFEHSSPTERFMIIIALMSVTLMEIIDSTIVNVALPAMQGALHATSDQITWVATAYIVTSGMFMPMTGYCSNLFGRKNYLVGCIIGFTIASMLCGLSTTLQELIIFRLIQGACGACLIPLSQSILTEIHKPEERGKAMAIWGMGIMIGPVLGPTLGGYLIEYLNWRWIFYVNLPCCVISGVLSAIFVPTFPKEKRSMNWISLILLFSSIGCFQYFLDRGQIANWFDSLDIWITFSVSIISCIAFIIYCLVTTHRPIFSLSIFKDKNFTLSTIILSVMGFGLYGSTVIHPIFLESILGYPSVLTGLVIMPRSITAAISIMIVSKAIGIIDSRILILIGFICNIIGLALSMDKFSTELSMFWVIAPFCIQGFGLGLIFIPLSNMAYSTIAPSLLDDASGVFSLFRTIGGSIGISLAINILVSESKKLTYHFNTFINPFNANAIRYAHALGGSLKSPHVLSIIEHTIANQSNVIGMLDAYQVMVYTFVAMLPLIWILDPQKNINHKPSIH